MYAGNRDTKERSARLALIFLVLAVASGGVIFASDHPGEPIVHGVFGVTVAMFLVMFVRIVTDGASRSIHQSREPIEPSDASQERERNR
jgi:hypothetical protein